VLKIAANHYLIIICFEESVGQRERKKKKREIKALVLRILI